MYTAVDNTPVLARPIVVALALRSVHASPQPVYLSAILVDGRWNFARWPRVPNTQPTPPLNLALLLPAKTVYTTDENIRNTDVYTIVSWLNYEENRI